MLIFGVDHPGCSRNKGQSNPIMDSSPHLTAMGTRKHILSISDLQVSNVPSWAVPRGPVSSDAGAAFMAGAALNTLDALVRAQPAWAGVWRQRQALKCAASAVRLAGRNEDEIALRDAWYLQPAGATASIEGLARLGPAGTILAAWRRLAATPAVVDVQVLEEIVALLGLRWSAPLAVIPEEIDALSRAGHTSPAPFAAAAIAARTATLRPDAELLAWWLADLVLAKSLNWPRPLPLLMAQAFTPALRVESARSMRIKPGSENFERAVCIAIAQGAAEACRTAGDIARKAERLAVISSKLRAKGAGDVLCLLLEEDAVPGSLTTRSLSRFASRRLFNRLQTFEAVRELTGRPVSRLYGL